jgi:hypothetical protein
MLVSSEHRALQASRRARIALKARANAGRASFRMLTSAPSLI